MEFVTGNRVRLVEIGELILVAKSLLTEKKKILFQYCIKEKGRIIDIRCDLASREHF